MLRIFLVLALLAVVRCRIGGGIFHTDYYYEGESESSESSSEPSSESSTVDVGKCCDDCPYCKDENAVCDIYGHAKMCICKDDFIFDYGCMKCVPGGDELGDPCLGRNPTFGRTCVDKTGI
ncbi:hypothetical protein MAR_032239 [Mya arenaria]|uniref:Uncharacterized protein n=1 Tax=Mya arenaria TaxID=6604 RepID=A0ABY7F620_MYAAR|nr:hypothetical protein MAR_032212 [Mya arenaria]WAR17620.1 hypothetical protein MAR_032214 [Mya arenaria]WAR17645.1 hypothetical protein MAR_032239 [Mya arenaria]